MSDSDADLVVGQLLPAIRSGRVPNHLIWKSVRGPGILAWFNGEKANGAYRLGRPSGT